jgi:hypothetical protein
MLATSDPDAGSDSAKADKALPARVFVSHSDFCPPAEQRDAAGCQPLHGKGEIGQPVMPGQRLAQDTQAAHVDLRRLVGRIDRGELEPAGIAQRLDQGFAGLVDI